MSNFGGKNVQNLTSAGASSQTPFEELTVLPLTPWLSWLHLRGHISKGRGGEEEERVNEGEKVGREKEFVPPIFTTDRRHCVQAGRQNQSFDNKRLMQSCVTK